MSIKISNTNLKDQDKVILMADMKPLQIGVTTRLGRVVMRTASEDKFEVMDLSNPGINSYWDRRNTVKVRLLNPGEKVTLELSNG